jgi:hypothetical protein
VHSDEVSVDFQESAPQSEGQEADASRHTGLWEHPAVRAWRQLQPQQGEPERIETLQDKKKSVIYRLHGRTGAPRREGSGGAAVIAKRCWRATAFLERTIYEDVLPHLPLPALHYYGFVEEEESPYCWLFLEDAGGEKYSPSIREHSVLAGRWLGRMHTSAVRIAAAARLPHRGPSHYLEHLRAGRQTILGSLSNPALKGDEWAVLETIIAQCDLLERRWRQVEKWCEGIPSTLVHGDFRPKNARVRIDPAGVTLFALDWETAGWGVPAADLPRVDIGAYWSVARECWPMLDSRAMERLANVGNLFRWLAAISWDSTRLEYGAGSKTMAGMRVCQAELSKALDALRWED